MNITVKDIYKNTKPYVRWWWFSGKIDPAVIKYQLDWCKENNFGGVELAFMYPLPDSEPGPEWLSEEWSEIVVFTKGYATKIGLGCDFTFGTSWPFGGSFINENDAAKNFYGLSTQRLEKSWEMAHGKKGLILNHLDHNALERYAEKIGEALKPALQISPSALFCDSWEVDTELLWTDGLEKLFMDEFGYDIRLYVRDLDKRQSVRYDYRKLIAKLIIDEFYRPFTDICHKLGGISRVQCHGSPTDLLAAYSVVDVPESESLLFDPHFSQIPASAAAITDKPIVSAETFTCIYGWLPYPGPGPYQDKEQIADLKLLADALFANGINFVIWHGMPYNPPGCKNRFYATVHTGPDCNFVKELPGFNHYLEKVSEFMRTGNPYGGAGVYLPLEDTWMLNELPEEFQRPSARYYWELQYVKFPDEVKGFRPIWITDHFLDNADFSNGVLKIGAMNLDFLYIDVDWIDIKALKNLNKLAERGCPICIIKKPSQPGFNKDKKYDDLVRKLFSQKSVSGIIQRTTIKPPLIEGRLIPEFWVRKIDEELIIFFSHPMTRSITYPMRYGQSFCETDMNIKIVLNYAGFKKDINLLFKPYQALLLRVSKYGNTKFEDINFSVPPSLISNIDEQRRF
ncbi:MAG: glycosyl hydrolase [candidate division WOR-3 bacterium]|nr:glycosyl hydrolase [candidate division WOR-3 bacterium]